MVMDNMEAMSTFMISSASSDEAEVVTSGCLVLVMNLLTSASDTGGMMMTSFSLLFDVGSVAYYLKQNATGEVARMWEGKRRRLTA